MGNSVDALWNGLLEGRCAIDFIKTLDATDLPAGDPVAAASVVTEASARLATRTVGFVTAENWAGDEDVLVSHALEQTYRDFAVGEALDHAVSEGLSEDLGDLFRELGV